MVATTIAGTSPAARSASIAAHNAAGRIAWLAGSTSTARTPSAPSPAIRAAFSMEECPWVDV